MDAYQTIVTLRSIRQFTDHALPDEVVERILQAGRWSGSSKNTQPWQFVAVRQRQVLTNLAACGRYASHLAGAALGIVVVFPPGFALFDAGRTCQNMMMAAWADGVGSCIASFHDEDKARSLLGVPNELECDTAISFGYPLPGATRTIEGRPIKNVLASTGRKPLSDLVHWEKW